ncbi:hypothetical protein [Ornithinimicrobium cavernae]|uniref:baeRF3 domain-containing protein n=1 Tax=Ornithinimicrobium cavernae TaxID=2666047 RepID=UPI000D691557|nr:hypothetical protein [Ornithinimicrobium cavernae]
MDLMTRAEFEELVGEGVGPRVSAFVPTHRAGHVRDGDGDRLRWKNLLVAVENRLLEDGLGRDAVKELLAPAWSLHGDGMAWSYMGDGLAMFLRPGWHATYRVPLDLPELATVGSDFVLTPVLPLLSDRNYVVLTVSQKNVRVLRGSRDQINELDVPSVPRAFEDVMTREGPQSDTVPRPNASGRPSQGGAVYYGASSLDNVHKEDLVEFLREVARGVEDHLAGRTIPLILAGLPEWVALYREISSYPHLIDPAIERNPDDMPVDDLRRAAWELVAERLSRENATLLDRLHEQFARGRGVVGFEETCRAAHEGRVDTLLLPPETSSAEPPGTRPVVRLVDYPDYALVASAVGATLRTGGAIRVVDELPGVVPAAAVVRY